MSAILSFCFIVVGQAVRSLHCFITLVVVCVFVFSILVRGQGLFLGMYIRFVSVVCIGILNLDFECERTHFGFVRASSNCAFGNFKIHASPFTKFVKFVELYL